MKALLLTSPGVLTYTEVSKPECGPDEVRVRVHACSICGSDVHGYTGEGGRRLPPVIMGHEASGEIECIGSEISSDVWKAGDRVTFDSTQYCGTCWFCRNGMHNLCTFRRILGVSCEDYKANGAMAEYVTVKAHTLYRIPDAVTWEEASLIEPFAVGMHAVSLAGSLTGQTTVIIGAGTIGLMTLLAAKTQSPKAIFVAAHHEERRQNAREMGADEAFESDSKFPQIVKKQTEGRGADIIFDSVGNESSIRTALSSVRNGGTIVVIGNMAKDITFPLQECVVRQIRLQFSYSSAGEYDTCLKMIQDKKVNLTPFLQVQIPLAEGADLFAQLKSKASGILKGILIISN